jgi:hypothetical protein
MTLEWVAESLVGFRYNNNNIEPDGKKAISWSEQLGRGNKR